MRERGERREKLRVENRGRNEKFLITNVRLQKVHNMAYIALQKGEKPKLS